MGILDGIVEWIAEQVMYGLDLINTSVLGALGCDMSVFLRYFPAAETMYEIFVALAIGLILLIWIWNLVKNFGLGIGTEAEDPVKLSIRAVVFILLAYYANEIVDLVLGIGGTPYDWIMNSALPSLDFGSFNSVLLIETGQTFTQETSSAGVAIFDQIPLGAYRIQEKSAPVGWQLDDTVYTATVVAGETTTIPSQCVLRETRRGHPGTN